MTQAMIPTHPLQQSKQACPSCNSETIIKWGKRKDKQVYKCKSCQKYFTAADARYEPSQESKQNRISSFSVGFLTYEKCRNYNCTHLL